MPLGSASTTSEYTEVREAFAKVGAHVQSACGLLRHAEEDRRRTGAGCGYTKTCKASMPVPAAAPRSMAHPTIANTESTSTGRRQIDCHQDVGFVAMPRLQHDFDGNLLRSSVWRRATTAGCRNRGSPRRPASRNVRSQRRAWNRLGAGVSRRRPAGILHDATLTPRCWSSAALQSDRPRERRPGAFHHAGARARRPRLRRSPSWQIPPSPRQRYNSRPGP